MLVRPSTAGLTERRGQVYPGRWPAILRRQDWEAARTILTDPRRDTRTFRKVAKRHALAGLLVCGRCDRLLVSNPLRGVPSFICSPTANGGCAKIRIQADHVERFLLGRIKERDAAGLESPSQARLRMSLRQLQDDHYDGLVDRADYLRQSQRLRSLITIRGWSKATEREISAGDKRTVLRRSLDRVVVLPHPAGRATSHLDWPQREALLNERLRLHWN
jgi:hypothetical protein